MTALTAKNVKSQTAHQSCGATMSYATKAKAELFILTVHTYMYKVIVNILYIPGCIKVLVNVNSVFNGAA